MSREQEIRENLERAFEPVHFQITNESGQHRHSADGESHFRVVMVSESFRGLNKIKRHQSVYAQLNDYFDAGLHALALELYSPDEWKGAQHQSPPCQNTV